MTVINSVAPVIVNSSGIQEESLSNLRDLLDQMKRRLSHIIEKEIYKVKLCLKVLITNKIICERKSFYDCLLCSTINICSWWS